MLKQLIHDKINEIFEEYREENNTNGVFIEPFDAQYLDELEQKLEQVITNICSYQPKAINFDDFTPSWYIYTDCDGYAHSETFNGEFDEDCFFTKVSKKICFDDLEDITVQKIYYKGKEVQYAGWQPGMRFEYKDLDGNTIWVGDFPHWDH